MKISQLFTSIMVGITGFSAFFDANAADQARGVRGVNVGPGTSNSPRYSLVTPSGIGSTLTLPNSPAVQVTTSPVNTNTIPTVTPTNPTPTYTVDQCMNELESCISNGALQGGINDLFNPDVRAGIMSCKGMRLCQSIIDKCLTIKDKYTNCEDVWFDFNSRIVQPEYYNFVLRKTGLTPNQAENTCLLLDRNVYGNSFTAVSDGYDVNSEYGRGVNAYNNQKDSTGATATKTNPIGADVNQNSYDMNRGHYARWDATNAECLVRVAAYNKDKPIKNEWLFGGIGDGKYAEVWQRAGSSFSCNKDLFGFSLMNDTKSAALVGGVGGVVIGTGVGIGVGYDIAKKKEKKLNEEITAENGKKLILDDIDKTKGQTVCDSKKFRAALKDNIMNNYQSWVVQSYVYDELYTASDNKSVDENRSQQHVIKWDTFVSDDTQGKEDCELIMGLYDKANLYENAIDGCLSNAKYNQVATCVDREMQVSAPTNTAIIMGDNYTAAVKTCCATAEKLDWDDPKVAALMGQYLKTCMFVPLQISFSVKNAKDKTFNPMCNADYSCRNVLSIKADIARMRRLLDSIKPYADEKTEKVTLDKGAMMGKGAAVGAAVGIGAAGLATAITAFVERENINCRVGDGLDQVGYGKTHTINSLKDFYTKWNLRLPDRIMPTNKVTDKTSLTTACAQFNSRLTDCPDVQVIYEYDDPVNKGTKKTTIVSNACVVNTGACIPNATVVTLYSIP